MNLMIPFDYSWFIYDSCMDAILLTTTDGKIYCANPAACEMFQMTEDEFRIVGCEGIADMGDPRLSMALQELKINKKVRITLPFKIKNGKVFIGEASASLFCDHADRTWSSLFIHDVTHYIKVEEDLKRIHNENQYYGTYDYLTGVLNRRAFVEKLVQEIYKANNDKTSISILMTDIDHFKQINDIYGHVNGDMVLKTFARCLNDGLRPGDLLGRLGGDEFIICLPDTQLEYGAITADRLRQKIELSDILKLNVKITASFGVVSYSHDNQEDIDSLISRADKNVYEAKVKRNSVFAQN